VALVFQSDDWLDYSGVGEGIQAVVSDVAMEIAVTTLEYLKTLWN
jgi:hypothetical protein